MSYCLKTGGKIYIEASESIHECDLHIVDKVVIALACYPADLISTRAALELPDLQLMIPDGIQYFEREAKPYGVIVVPQIGCEIMNTLKQHCREWYNNKRFTFANYSQ